MRKADLYKHVIDYFSEAMPVAETELHYDNPFQLLVAVVLSAQCTDKRVNMVTPALFEAYPDAESMACATEEDIFHYIHSVSYPNNKSHHLVGLARMLRDEYGGTVPSDIDALQRLPGVGRKTANVVAAAGEAYTVRTAAQGSPLAYPPWPLRMSGPQAQMRHLRPGWHLPPQPNH